MPGAAAIPHIAKSRAEHTFFDFNPALQRNEELVVGSLAQFHISFPQEGIVYVDEEMPEKEKE